MVLIYEKGSVRMDKACDFPESGSVTAIKAAAFPKKVI